MKIKMMLTAMTVCAAFVLTPTAAGAAPVTGGAGADYGHHVSTHARDQGFSGQMNPGGHQGYSGFDEHHHCSPDDRQVTARVQSPRTEGEGA